MATRAELRELVAQRARRCCEYCRSQERFSADAFSVDHIVPKTTGGDDDVTNLAFACQGCNNHKFSATEAVDPHTGQPVPLFNPRKQSWDEHFAWDDTFERIEGRTASGRATVARLRLNRPHLINLRCVLRLARAHPPAP